MVSTRQSTKSRQIVQEDLSGDDSGEDYDHEGSLGSVMARVPKPRASRKAISKQKGKQPERRRNAGKLSRLPDMPLDILYEIFSLVRPVDLLRMSWANKAFRNVITSKSSRQVWIAAFENIPEVQRPPPCPGSLTEIAYANLLYNPRCMGCGTPRASAYWTALVRVCMSCVKDWVTITGGVQDRLVVTLSRDKLSSSNQVLPCIYIKIPPLPKRFYVFTKDLDQLRADLEATDDKAAVIQRYSDAVVAKSKLAHKLGKLEKMEKADREAALTASHDRRIDQILERLADEGWSEEISSNRNEYVRSITQVKGVKVARPLTEKAWGEIEVQTLNAMQKCKREIEKKALEDRCISRVARVREIVGKYERTLGPYDFCLSAHEVCRVPDIRKVIIDGTDGEFDSCAEEVYLRLPILTSGFLEERTTKISALLPFKKRTEDVLSLATAWVECGSCITHPMHATDALKHYCSTAWTYPYRRPVGEATFDIRTQGRAWCGGGTKLQFSRHFSIVTRGLILDCGEDPETITWAEINTKLHRFFDHRTTDIVVYSLGEVLGLKSRNPTISMSYRFLRPDEHPEFVHDPGTYNETQLWNCFHCWRDNKAWTFRAGFFATLSAIKQHIADEHEVDTPIERVDYYFYEKNRSPKFVRVAQGPASTGPPL